VSDGDRLGAGRDTRSARTVRSPASCGTVAADAARRRAGTVRAPARTIRVAAEPSGLAPEPSRVALELSGSRRNCPLLRKHCPPPRRSCPPPHRSSPPPRRNRPRSFRAGRRGADGSRIAAGASRPRAGAGRGRFCRARRRSPASSNASNPVFRRYGLADQPLEELAAAVAEYDAALEETHAGRRDHVGARADLRAVGDEIMQLGELMNGLNRCRFAADAEQLAAWESARNVIAPARAAAVSPEEGEVKPAA
jgi:hypothetical protein